MDVEGKAAVITGGGTGVGRATGLILGKLGCSVLVNYSRSQADAEATNATAQRAPLGKVSEPEDIGEAIVSLVTGSDMVTAQVVVVDGGMLIQN